MLDPSTLADYGLPALFGIAFLAGSLLPLPSEALLAALIAGGVDPVHASIVASSGNLLGAFSLYWLGGRLVRNPDGFLRGWAARVVGPAHSSDRHERALRGLRRWGPGLLLLSWLPVVGDLLVLGAGSIGVRLFPFLLLTGIGKAARFAAVAYAAHTLALTFIV